MFNILYIPSMYHSSTFCGSKIFHVYLCRSILFSFISISTKRIEHELFFSSVNEEVYSEVHIPFA